MMGRRTRGSIPQSEGENPFGLVTEGLNQITRAFRYKRFDMTAWVLIKGR
jgi:hypothetical protein